MDEKLVKLYVEQGEDLTLSELVENARHCQMNCNLFGNNQEYNHLEKELIKAVNAEFPKAVDWSGGSFV